jgi:hypothetical protein
VRDRLRRVGALADQPLHLGLHKRRQLQHCRRTRQRLVVQRGVGT